MARNKGLGRAYGFEDNKYIFTVSCKNFKISLEYFYYDRTTGNVSALNIN